MTGHAYTGVPRWIHALAVLAALMVLLPLLAMVLPPADTRLAVTVASVLAALALTGWSSARLGAAAPGRAILRTTAGGALAMGVTSAAGSALDVAGV